MRRFALSLLLGTCVVWSPGSTTALAEPDAKSEPAQLRRYEYRRDHDPNGIGKFYMGREIAHVMGFLGVKWLERPEREEEEQPAKLIEALRLEPGMVVADIGAGSGVIAIPMAPKVAPGGKVIAVDIQKEMLDRLRKKLEQREIKNVELVLGALKSPRLKKDSVDLAILVDVYHEFAYPYEMMLELSQAVKPGGRVAFVEYRKEDPQVRQLIKLVHTMTEEQVQKEIGQPEFGLKWKETLDVLPRQHIVVFEKQPPANEGPPAE
jgi:ubiquinone/menaquinone biosynthesis C-methylase UbiE